MASKSSARHWMQETDVVACGILVRDDGPVEPQHLRRDLQHTKIVRFVQALEQHRIAGMKIQIGVLVKFQAARYLLAVAPVLHRLKGDGLMLELRRPFVGEDAMSDHRTDIRHRHDAMQFGDAWVHRYAPASARSCRQ
jgi:hypothetical protein